MNNDIGVSATVERGYRADAAVVAEPTAAAAPLTVMPVVAGPALVHALGAGRPTHAPTAAGRFIPTAAASRSASARSTRACWSTRALRRARAGVGVLEAAPAVPPGQFTIMPGIVDGGTSGVAVPAVRPRRRCASSTCSGIRPTPMPPPIMARDREPCAARRGDRRVAARARARDRLAAALAGQRSDPPMRSRLRSALRTNAPPPAPARGTGRVAGFPAVDDATWLTLGGMPAISYGPGDLRLAHGDDESCDRRGRLRDAGVRAARDGLVRRRGLAATKRPANVPIEPSREKRGELAMCDGVNSPRSR